MSTQRAPLLTRTRVGLTWLFAIAVLVAYVVFDQAGHNPLALLAIPVFAVLALLTWPRSRVWDPRRSRES